MRRAEKLVKSESGKGLPHQKSVLIAGIASLGLAASALAGAPVKTTPVSHNGFYLGMAGGVNIPKGNDTMFINNITGATSGYDEALNTGFDFILRVGYRISQFRIETEASIISSKFKLSNNGRYNTGLFMLNGYYDFNTGTRFTPFVGAGIGSASSNTQVGDSVGVSDDAFAAQGMAGVAMKISDNTALDLFYTYVGYGGDYGDSHNNLVNVGFNYFFA